MSLGERVRDVSAVLVPLFRSRYGSGMAGLLALSHRRES